MGYNTKSQTMHVESDNTPHRVTPQQQLWELTDESQHNAMRGVLRHLKKRYQEDLCYAMVAYLRFGIRRPFVNPFLQMIYKDFIDLADGTLKPVV